jgi:hypothetical protein
MVLPDTPRTMRRRCGNRLLQEFAGQIYLSLYNQFVQVKKMLLLKYLAFVSDKKYYSRVELRQSNCALPQRATAR